MLAINPDSIEEIRHSWREMEKAAFEAYRPKLKLSTIRVGFTDVWIETAVAATGSKARARMYRKDKDNILADTGLVTKTTMDEKVKLWLTMQYEIEKRRL